jgi:hypothetical protein
MPNFTAFATLMAITMSKEVTAIQWVAFWGLMVRGSSKSGG